MKYIKTYEESNIEYNPKFKVGDIVYVRNNRETSMLKRNKPYTITIVEEKDRSGIPVFYYELNYLPDNSYSEDRFISELEYEANKYNL